MTFEEVLADFEKLHGHPPGSEEEDALMYFHLWGFFDQ